MTTILILHGDSDARRALAQMLQSEHFFPIEAQSAEDGLKKARTLTPELIILDVPVPGIGGSELIMQLKALPSPPPLIALSPGDEIDRILLLEVGADDCLLKPCNPRELLARARAVLRRTGQNDRKTLRFAEVEVDPERRAITRAGKQVSLTPCEYKLLLFFMRNVDRPLTRDLLLNSVWGYDDYPNTRTVDNHVMRLRSKFEPDPAAPRHFVTIHGVGYRFLV